GDGSGTEILEPDSNDLFQVQHVFQLPEMKLISVNLRDEDGGENLLEFPFPIMPRIRVTAEPDTTVEEGEDVIFTSIAEGAEEEMLFGEWLIKDESGDIIDGEEALFTFLYLFADNGSYEVICIAYMEIEMYLMYLEQQAMQILEQLQDSEYYQYMEQILAYVLQNYTDYYSEDELMMMFSDMDTLSVSVLNVAPQADAGPDTTGIEQQSLPFIGSFTDPGPEDTHTIEWDFGDGSPVSTTIVTSHSFAVPGDYTVVLTVTDKDGDAGTDSCMVTIEPDNQKPELIPIADQVMDEGDSLTVNITAADADGDTVEISAQNLPAFAALTDYGNNTGSLLLTPDYEQAGIYTAVSVMVSDGELSDTTTFSITVNDVNRAPELTTIPDQMVDEGDTLLIPLTASDPDTGDVISFSVSALPQFGALTDQGEGTAEIMLSPDYNQAGSYEGISVMVSDGELSDTTTFSITVNNVNRAPELTTIPDQMMDEADTLVVSLTAADPDSGDMVILSVSNLPQFGSFTDQGEGMGEIMIYPDYEQAGSYENILIQASDGTLADSVSFTLTVTNVNRKPVMADIADQEMDIWESLQVSCSATDPDQEPLTYSLSNAPDFAQLTDQGDGTADILCAPQVTEDGVYADIMVIVSDGDLADTTWFQLTVYPGIFTQGLALIVYQGIDVNTGVIQGAAQQLTGQQIKMEGNALLQGDLLVPGTPSISVQEQAQYTGIQEGSGSTEPSGYTITLRGNASVGWIRTRTDPVDMPQVVPPAAPAGTRYVNLNQPGDSPGDFATIRNLTLNADYGTLSVPPGTYGHFTANSQTGFVLGIPGSAQPVVYEFEYLTINANSTLEVVGPVIVIVGQGFNPNGQVGTPGMAAYLELQIAAGQVILNSGSELHCNLMAPNSQVMVNGGAFIIGGIACDELRLNGNAVIQVEGF
ncbi:MAG: PKD domain-containing protein, partial [bacterium]